MSTKHDIFFGKLEKSDLFYLLVIKVQIKRKLRIFNKDFFIYNNILFKNFVILILL